LAEGRRVVIAHLFSALLWAIAGALLLVAWRRRDGTHREAITRAWREFLWLLPRLTIGIVSSGFIAALLPEETVARQLGPDSGLTGLLFATLAGALTPGGPVVGFSVGTAALRAGAGLAPVVAYVTAWSLISLNRMLVWEAPIMPRRFMLLRIVVSLPLPVLAGLAIMLLTAQRP